MKEFKTSLNRLGTDYIDLYLIHPFFHQSSLRKLMKDYGIQVQAWGPLCEGMKNIFQHPVLENIAKKHQKSIAQIALKWSVQMGNSVIPKSTNPVHLEENVALWDFELDQEDLDQIKQLDIGYSEIIDHKNLAVVKGLNLCLGSKKTPV